MVRLIRDPELRQLLGGVSVMTLHRMRKREQLPKPKKLNGQNVTPEDEIDAAIKHLLGGDAA
jgi:predicted DNA-binding transcriptional regulator AlpA